MAAPPLTGQVTTSGTPQPLTETPSSPTSWIVKAPAANVSTVYIGGSAVTTGTGYPLEPGDSIEFDRRMQPGAVYDLAPADLYVVGSGGVAAWLAFR